MQKLLLIILSLVLLFNITACRAEEANPGQTEETTKTVETTNPPDSEDAETGGDETVKTDQGLLDILDQIYATADVSDQFKDFIANGLQTSPITKENSEYHLGKAGIEFESAIISEPIMSTSAYALALIRVKEGADIEKTKTEIKENANPQKWICVGVDPGNIIVDSVGDVIILIMSDNEPAALHNAFTAL